MAENAFRKGVSRIELIVGSTSGPRLVWVVRGGRDGEAPATQNSSQYAAGSVCYDPRRHHRSGFLRRAHR